MFQYDFMQHAFAAGTVVAIMCGAIGVFVIARSLSFIAHSFSHIGFSGAAFAVCIGWNPLSGLLLFTSISALAIGGFGVKVFRRDVTISIILSLFLGLGLLFIALSTKQATAMYALLFGSVVGISMSSVWEMLLLSLFVLALLVVLYKPLKFDSFDPVGAQAARLPVRVLSVAFLILLGIASSEAIQIVGSLLVFTLMTAPAATARYLTNTVFRMIMASAFLAVIGVWGGLVLSYYTNAPVTFFIATLECIFYFMALGWHALRERRKARTVEAVTPVWQRA
ncbi:ABC transporter [Gordoniibacillus kamchatkensis]|uniref:ABC transporter n=1 Tax=Gordoniibacillus kamchatkensis TaxID=1590651 RepID=A0ABR5AI04_9BACL|nr:metal ABC transporter permease [Paenibacillus sp. VKM B-2647]KIL40596.1 ABC transporter [Paenibacillus sp. VKM B-2647]